MCAVVNAMAGGCREDVVVGGAALFWLRLLVYSPPEMAKLYFLPAASVWWPLLRLTAFIVGFILRKEHRQIRYIQQSNNRIYST
jgi:hypothetical protein